MKEKSKRLAMSKDSDPAVPNVNELVPPSKSDLTDEALLSAVAGGSAWALESLYDRYSRMLYSLAYRMVADPQIAEDLIQDSFLSIWRRATSFTPTAGTARNWLISILHHRAIDYLRRVRRRSVIQEAPLEEADFDETTAFPDVWHEAWCNVKSSQIHAALMKIPTGQRLVIELAYFQGWTHTEIAEGTQIPLGTVKARMRLGLIHLKRELSQLGLDEI
jgi:RNA polymerase sigma-70 factor (ECF subfamily)